VLVPVLPGVFTAVGMLASDVEHHFVRSAATRLDRADFDAINTLLGEMAGEGRSRLAAEGYDAGAMRLQFLADVRFLGQGSELSVPLPGGALSPADLQELAEAFATEYRRTYGHAEDDPLELVNLRLIATGLRSDRLAFEDLGAASLSGWVDGGRRPVYLSREDGLRDVEVLDRAAVGDELKGPVIVESYDSTVLIPEGCRAQCDKIGNILIEIG
jgi:N-methylhydantoinase A